MFEEEPVRIPIDDPDDDKEPGLISRIIGTILDPPSPFDGGKDKPDGSTYGE